MAQKPVTMAIVREEVSQVSRGSVATHWRYGGGNSNDDFVAKWPLSLATEEVIIIGHHSAKRWASTITVANVLAFLRHPVYTTALIYTSKVAAWRSGSVVGLDQRG